MECTDNRIIMLDNNLPLQCSVVVSKIGEVPCIELRRRVTDVEVLKKVVWCALHDQPIIILPRFGDRFRSISSLINAGVVTYDKESGQYFFTI